MSLSGPLYRRTPRLFNKNKPGDWTLVWCELPLEQGEGELIVYQEQHSRRRLITIPVRDCDIAHVRSDGRDCVEITISKSKKETFSSHESSFDVDWWYGLPECMWIYCGCCIRDLTRAVMCVCHCSMLYF